MTTKTTREGVVTITKETVQGMIDDVKRMKNIKLTKAKKRGWYVEIDDGVVTDKIAFTSVELWALGKMIKDNMSKIMKDISLEDNK